MELRKLINVGSELEKEPGEDVDILIEDITGPTSVRIAGESAAFTIAITETQYDLFKHD